MLDYRAQLNASLSWNNIFWYSALYFGYARGAAASDDITVDFRDSIFDSIRRVDAIGLQFRRLSY